jgi:hypothetical protein
MEFKPADLTLRSRAKHGVSKGGRWTLLVAVLRDVRKSALPRTRLPGRGCQDEVDLRNDSNLGNDDLGSPTRPRQETHLDIAAPRPPRSGIDEIGQALPAHIADRISIKARAHIGEVVGPVIVDVIAVRKALRGRRAAGSADHDAERGETKPQPAAQRWPALRSGPHGAFLRPQPAAPHDSCILSKFRSVDQRDRRQMQHHFREPRTWRGTRPRAGMGRGRA